MGGAGASAGRTRLVVRMCQSIRGLSAQGFRFSEFEGWSIKLDEILGDLIEKLNQYIENFNQLIWRGFGKFDRLWLSGTY
jgi:hypothetical protein